MAAIFIFLCDNFFIVACLWWMKEFLILYMLQNVMASKRGCVPSGNSPGKPPSKKLSRDRKSGGSGASSGTLFEPSRAEVIFISYNPLPPCMSCSHLHLCYAIISFCFNDYFLILFYFLIPAIIYTVSPPAIPVYPQLHLKVIDA